MEELLIVIVCLFFNALFACYEMAFVSIPKAQLRSLIGNSAKAQTLMKLRQNPERVLSVIQIGITLVGMISAAVGGAGAEEFFAPIIETKFGLSENAAEALAILIVVIPLTYFSVVFGELVPKSIALRNPLPISTAGARWIAFADRLMGPLVFLLEWSTKIVLKLLALGSKKPVLAPSEEPIEMEGLSQQTRQYVFNLVSIEAKRVRDVMLPWPQVQKINKSDDAETVTDLILKSGHTRLPVVEDENVVGILHTKEFIALIAGGLKEWTTLIRPVVSVHELDPALKALRLSQAKRSHMAIVFSYDLKPVGIVTMEDVIEEVVGDIFDEDDDGRIKRLLGNNPRFRFMVQGDKASE